MAIRTDAETEHRQRPTMRDVATLAGVSFKTVSRVMNKVPTVDPALSSRVNEAADKLGYRMNWTASNLRRKGRAQAVGLLLEDLSNPYSATLHDRVEQGLRNRELVLLTASLDEDPGRERQLARALIDRGVDALIIVPAGDDHRYLVQEQLAGIAIVFVDRAPVPLVADCVLTENRNGAREGVQHLLRQSFRRVAYLGDDQGIFTARKRYTGYLEALDSFDLSTDETLIRHGVGTAEAAHAALLELFAGENPPDAVFSARNTITVGAVRALHELGLHKQVAFVGFDDVPLAETVSPGVTVVVQDVAEIAELATERLLARLDGDDSPPETYSLPTRLIQRGSGELRIR